MARKKQHLDDSTSEPEPKTQEGTTPGRGYSVDPPAPEPVPEPVPEPIPSGYSTDTNVKPSDPPSDPPSE